MKKDSNKPEGEKSYVPAERLRPSDFIPSKGRDEFYERNTGKSSLHRLIDGEDPILFSLGVRSAEMTPLARENLDILDLANFGYNSLMVLGASGLITGLIAAAHYLTN
ncbi:hypothetical protein GOV13_05540 [Candidatus Pacearchaeota archaeon]|nr:hypothetical protein [Candidatus Pacearchaeota archaeon]